jgi:hypothetical protein
VTSGAATIDGKLVGASAACGYGAVGDWGGGANCVAVWGGGNRIERGAPGLGIVASEGNLEVGSPGNGDVGGGNAADGNAADGAAADGGVGKLPLGRGLAPTKLPPTGAMPAAKLASSINLR